MKLFKSTYLLGALAIVIEPALAGSNSHRTSELAVRNEAMQNTATPAATSPTFLQDVVPILMGKCYRFHNQQTAFLSNWLDYRTAFNDRAEMKRRIWDSWNGSYFKQPMPILNSPEAESITSEERAIIKRWIQNGAAYGVPQPETNARSKAERVEAGRKLFSTICAACHQPTGLGLPNQFPPLAGSDFLNSDKQRAIGVLVHGLQGEVVVNGLRFNNSMPQLPLSDGQIAAALTYVYSSFGNSGQDVTAEEVKAVRAHSGADATTAINGHRPTRPTQDSPWE